MNHLMNHVKNLFIKLKVDPKDLTGCTILITGGSYGIGFHTAIHLAKMNATIVIASSNVAKGEEAVVQIKHESGNQNITYRQLDLGSIEGVKQFCEDFKRDYDSLDLLINNAGTSFFNYGTTEDNLEQTFHVNHLGPFILTLKLLPIIKRGRNPRIVNLSSEAHTFHTIELPEDLGCDPNTYKFLRQYSKSKLMNILFTKELSKRLADKKIIVVAVHPGFVKTNIKFHTLENPFIRILSKLLMTILQQLLARNGEQGAMTSVFAAIDDSVVTGEYYDSCAVGWVQPQGHDLKLARALWDASADLARIDRNIV